MLLSQEALSPLWLTFDKRVPYVYSRSYALLCCCIIKGFFFSFLCAAFMILFSIQFFNFISFMNGKANKSSERKRQNNGLELNEILNSYVILPFRLLKRNKKLSVNLPLVINSLAAKKNQFSLCEIFIYYFFFRTL